MSATKASAVVPMLVAASLSIGVPWVRADVGVGADRNKADRELVARGSEPGGRTHEANGSDRGKDASNSGASKDHPHSGRGSPEGKTAKEREAFLRRESEEHPESYKDTKAYKGATPETRQKVDEAVERNRKALEAEKKRASKANDHVK